jgi:transcriptional regulator with XRE-family HTH domain
VSDEVPLSYARAVGDRLRNLRRQRGLSLLAVEESSDREFKASVLGAYERGERIISVLRLQRLAQLYRVPVDQLLPRPLAPGSMDNRGGDSAGTEPSPDRPPVRIDLIRLGEIEAPERDVLRRYLNMIQVQRGDFSGRTVTIRGEDLRALGRVFERDEVGMRVRLQELGVRD